MFTLRDRRTGELFDRWSDFGDKRRRLMEQSWAGVFRNHLLVELPVDDLCRHLDERMGRPSKDLHVVIGVLLLQQLHDLSDAETVEALAFNMAWHYTLDVRSEADSYFCEKTLRNYRRLFTEQGLDELLFRCLTGRMVQGFSVDTSHQRMDSTALRSAMRALTRLGIVVEIISKFARELERYHPGLHEQISKEVIRRYVDREGNGAFANPAPSVSKRRLGEAGQDLLSPRGDRDQDRVLRVLNDGCRQPRAAKWRHGKVSFASRSVGRGSKGFRRTLAEQGVGVHEIIQGASQSATSRYRQKAFAN